MKRIMLILVLVLLPLVNFAQTDTGELDKDGRIIYERVFDNASVEVEETHLIDEDLYRIFDHRGMFRIGKQENYNKFPFKMFVKYKAERRLLILNVNYVFEGNNMIITAKNSVDEITFPLGIQYYIVVRYTKK